MRPPAVAVNQFIDKCVGELANRPATKKGTATAISMYNDFAAHSKGASQYDQLTSNFLNGEVEGGDGVTNLHSLLRKFAAYVLLPLKKGKNGKMEYYKPDSAAQYYSNLKSGLSKKFPSIKILQPPNDDWYNHLWRLVKLTASARAFKMGEQTSCGSDSIWKATLEETCGCPCKRGDSNASELFVSHHATSFQ